MKLCIPYRYYVAIFASLGLCIMISLRYNFVLIVTDTNQQALPLVGVDTGNGTSADEPARGTSILPECPTVNTSSDFKSNFTEKMSFQFYTMFHIGNICGFLLTTLVFSRLPAHHVLSVSAILNGLIALILPLVFVASSKQGALFLRFCHGVGLSVLRPSIVSVVANWAPRTQTTTLMSLALFGGVIAPSLSNLVTGFMICFVNWNSSFLLYGGLGILWSVIWIATYYPEPEDCPCVEPEEMEMLGYKHINESKTVKRRMREKTPWKEIFTSKPLWSIWLCEMSKSWILSTLIDLQPQFFHDIYNIRAADIGLLLSVQPLGCAMMMYVSGRVADRLITLECCSTTNARKLTQAVGGFMEAIFIISAAFAPSWSLAYICFLLAFSFDGFSTTGLQCNGAELAPRYSLTLASIIFTGNVGGVMNTFLTSYIAGVNSTQANWGVSFIIGGVLTILSTVLYIFIASAEIQPWDAMQTQEFKLVPIKEHKELYALLSGYSSGSSEEDSDEGTSGAKNNTLVDNDDDFLD